MMTRDQELWAMALRSRSTMASTAAFIAAQIERLVVHGEEGALALWRKVEDW
jgi:hypothetical protein